MRDLIAATVWIVFALNILFGFAFLVIRALSDAP